MVIFPSPPPLLYDCDKVTGDKMEEFEITLIFFDSSLGSVLITHLLAWKRDGGPALHRAAKVPIGGR